MANKSEFFFSSHDGKHKIHTLIWLPDSGDPKAVLQIAHGLLEYADRYDDFARFMADKGFAVTANDHLGHGNSFTSEKEYGFFAEKGGWELVVRDMHRLFEITKEKYPSVPYYLLGHSMGSFLSRTYLSKYPGELTGCILSGTGDQSSVICDLGAFAAKGEVRRLGLYGRSERINKLGFGSYNKRISSPRTDCDWLSKDEKLVDKYVADPKCGGIPTLSLFLDMFSGFKFIGNRENILKMDKKTPLFLIAGKEDPVGNYGKSVQKLYDRLKTYDFADVSIKLYDGDRHEVLNELDKETVYEDVYGWLIKHI